MLLLLTAASSCFIRLRLLSRRPLVVFVAPHKIFLLMKNNVVAGGPQQVPEKRDSFEPSARRAKKKIKGHKNHIIQEERSERKKKM